MTIEPSLVRTDRDREAYNTEPADDKLSNETRNRIFGSRDASKGRSDVSQNEADAMLPFAPLQWHHVDH
jgi:hypothetical protein